MSQLLQYRSPRSTPNPPVLNVVAAIFIAYGGIGIASIFASLLYGGRVSLDCASPLIIVWGIGLLRQNAACYSMALVVLWGAMIFAVLIALNVFVDKADIRFAGASITPYWLNLALSLTISITLFSLSLWQYRILRRPDIKKLFETPRR
ncbi:MAG: hypothetical protein ACTHN5_15370 [Phycisphaerae bacterium]